MKLSFRLIILIAVLTFNSNRSTAQDSPLSEEYKEQTIQSLSQFMDDYYVFPEIAKSTEEHLITQFSEGHFKQFETNESFAEALTESVQSINNDKHMRIRVNPPYEKPDNTPERKVEERLHQINRSRSFNTGFNTVKILEGNVAYLDYRGFAGMDSGKELTDSYMKLMSRADAVIIDLSKNGGGSPAMVQYLCSFFFDQHLHLNSLYYRAGNDTIEYWTLDEVGGLKMADVPLFVITSSRTFSGAEEFAYNMQTRRRATLIGQTSGGGANPGRSMGLNEYLNVFIPTGMAINPITHKNWEGVGVIPEIKTSVEETLEKTQELARAAAEAYRAEKKEQYTSLFLNLNNQLDQYSIEKSDEAILESLTKCQEANFLVEGDINILGYEYLLEHEKPKVAESIFKANTMLNPNSANVYDSYAESLVMNGELDTALINYQKAVELAIENKDGNLQLFKENLDNLKSKIEKAK